MSLIPEIPNPYLGSFAIGLIYGLGVCTASCLPYIAGYVAGIGAGFRQGVKVTLFFNAGRVLAYALIGILVGLIGELLTTFNPDVFSPFQIYASIVFGAITVAIGSSILWKKQRENPDCIAKTVKGLSTDRSRIFGVDFGAFALGVSRGLIVCPPLFAILLTYALPFSNAIGSMTLAVLFGIGTTISPLLVLGGVMGWLLNKAPLFRKWISLVGAAILILLGVITMITSITQLLT